jgi:hypothetical protein
MSLTKTKEFYMTTLLLSSINKKALISKVTNWLNKPKNKLTVAIWTVRIISWLLGLGEGPVATLTFLIAKGLINSYKFN